MAEFDISTIPNELDALIETVAANAECAAVVPDTADQHKIALYTLHEVSTACRGLAIAVGTDAVTRKILSRAEVAQRLNVHPNTISRWLTAQAADAPGTPPSDQGHHPAT